MSKNKNHVRRSCSGPGTLLQTRALMAIMIAECFAPGISHAQALMLGEIEARSLLGEPFAARVPLQISADDALGLQCIRVVPHPLAAQGVPLPARLNTDLETIAGKQWITLRSPSVVTAPIVGMRVEVDCSRNLTKDFVVLLDPARLELSRAQEPPLALAPQPPVATAPPEQGAGAPAKPSARALPAKAAPTSTKASKKQSPDKQQALVQTSSREHARTADPVSTTGNSGEFVLRIDAGPLELSRSEGITEAQRDHLRAISRAIANSDDRVAAELEMMDRIKKLEEQAAELRDRIAQQPAAAPATQAANPVAVDERVIGQAPDARPWLLGGVLALLGLVGIAWWRKRRKSASTDRSYSESATPAPSPAESAQPSDTTVTGEHPVFVASADEETRREDKAAAPALPPMVVTGSDEAPVFNASAAAMRDKPPVTHDSITFNTPSAFPKRSPQEEYYAGRFGGPSQDVRSLKNLDYVIEQARSIYQDDGNAVKAADLLELTVSLRHDVIGPWLALFAIYRRESMAPQFAKLAVKFSSRFPLNPHWPTVQNLGREIEASNPLYCPPLATNGAVAAPAASTSQQDVTDEWLGIALEFNSSLLADELRDRLMKNAVAGAHPLTATGG